MTSFSNLTAHDITILVEAQQIRVKPSGKIARVAITRRREYMTYGEIRVPVVRSAFGEILDLPEPVEGTIYIASRTVCDLVRREDVFCVGHKKRDETDRIVGCTGLNSYPEMEKFYRS